MPLHLGSMANLCRRHTTEHSFAESYLQQYSHTTRETVLVFFKFVSPTLRKSLISGLSSVFCWIRVAPFSWHEQNLQTQRKEIRCFFFPQGEILSLTWLLFGFNSWQVIPDVRLHVRQLIGQDVADHLHRHPVARHLLPYSKSPAGGDRETRF